MTYNNQILIIILYNNAEACILNYKRYKHGTLYGIVGTWTVDWDVIMCESCRPKTIPSSYVYQSGHEYRKELTLKVNLPLRADKLCCLSFNLSF